MTDQRKARLPAFALVLAALVFYGLWAMRLPASMAPDEAMRYQIPQWILQHHALPHGDEPELINPIWGFSYGFTPYLPSLLSVLCMGAFSLFTQSAGALVFASRLPSVLAGVLTVWLSLKIGGEIFHGKAEKYLYAILIGFLPQFAFVSAYLNNDGFSVMTCCWILYGWLLGKKRRWDCKSCAFLAVGISLCALTYYNAYGYILCSILVFAADILTDRTRQHPWKDFFVHGFFIAGIFLVLAGWFFIRNLIIHDGDLLGMSSMYACGEVYAQEEFKFSQRQTNKALGLSYGSILFNRDWLDTTFKSLVAVFGYMNVFVREDIYRIYFWVLAAGLALYLVSRLSGKNRPEHPRINACAWLCCLIPFLLSVQYSYAIDYQAQGRYVMSCLPALMLLVTSGYEQLGNALGRRGGRVLSAGLCTLLLLLFLAVYLLYAVRWCWGGIL